MKTLQILIPILFIVSINTLGYGQNNKDKSNYDDVIFRDDYPGHNEKASTTKNAEIPNQKLLFENNELKISEIHLLPGESKNIEPLAMPSVICIRENADFTDTAGAVVFDTRNLVKPLIFPNNLYKEPVTIHQITNLSTTKSLRLIRMEMKD